MAQTVPLFGWAMGNTISEAEKAFSYIPKDLLFCPCFCPHFFP